jgi:hypothetical protein
VGEKYVAFCPTCSQTRGVAARVPLGTEQCLESGRFTRLQRSWVRNACDFHESKSVRGGRCIDVSVQYR